MDAEYDILDWQLGNSLVNINHGHGSGLDKGLPVFECSSIFSVMRYGLAH
jgi:hypothetical protein